MQTACTEIQNHQHKIWLQNDYKRKNILQKNAKGQQKPTKWDKVTQTYCEAVCFIPVQGENACSCLGFSIIFATLFIYLFFLQI